MSWRAVTEISLGDLKPARRGKVREIFDLGDRLLMVATDRLSAFDVVLPTGIPDRGKVLNQLSAFWFEKLSFLVPHHMITIEDREIAEVLGKNYDEEQLRGRSMLVEKCEPILLECVARGYIEGSLYKEYKEAGGEERGAEIHQISFPPGLKRADRLPEPIFTPATKAQTGHDENISFEEAERLLGKLYPGFPNLTGRLRDLTLQLYREASDTCEKAGIILADTKFEFGFCGGEVKLIDEALTPDSSRYWALAEYVPGKAQTSFDKQFVRDYLETVPWDKTPPGPELPEEVVRETRERYLEIFRRLTGREPVL
jgi:phosphoribosylaminoimidazole-succinocarboxamide synthase